MATNKENNPHILFILPGPVIPTDNYQKNRFNFLSCKSSGVILCPRWGENNNEWKEKLKDSDKASGDFQLISIRTFQLPSIVKIFCEVMFYLFHAVYQHYFIRRFDVIISYGPYKTGLSAAISSLLLGTKLIIEIPGNPWAAFRLQERKPSLKSRIKSSIAHFLVPLILRHSDAIRLLYPDQLENKVPEVNEKCFVFHEFVGLNAIPEGEGRGNYIITAGFPWHLKGVDILIKAFNKLSPEFPDLELKVAGQRDGKDEFMKLVDNPDKVELLSPVPNEELMHLIRGSSIFALASRTEAMGRVLLEAMKSSRPIVASRVDGIPSYIEDGYNGLLFESENVDDLAGKLRELLENPQKAEELAKNAYRKVTEELNENVYVEKMLEMIDRA